MVIRLIGYSRSGYGPNESISFKAWFRVCLGFLQIIGFTNWTELMHHTCFQYLSPFDRLVYDRVRAQELFEFGSTLEMYKPHHDLGCTGRAWRSGLVAHAQRCRTALTSSGGDGSSRVAPPSLICKSRSSTDPVCGCGALRPRGGDMAEPLEEVTNAAFNGVLRALEARKLDIKHWPGPIIVGIIAWPELEQGGVFRNAGEAEK